MNIWRKILGWQKGDYVKCETNRTYYGIINLNFPRSTNYVTIRVLKINGFDVKKPLMIASHVGDLKEWTPRNPEKIQRLLKRLGGM